MTQKYPLHGAILENDLNRFQDLLFHSNVNINQRNENGETPLTLCIKYYRSAEYFELLLKQGCDVFVCDQNNASPLWLSLAHSTMNISKLLITYREDMYCANQNGISKPLLYVMKKRQWKFEIFYVEQSHKILICSYRLRCRGQSKSHTYIHEINPFLDHFLLDQEVDKRLFEDVLKQIIDRSLKQSKPTIFKCVWNKVFNSSVRESCAVITLSTLFNRGCAFEDSEFIKCFGFILDSIKTSNFYYKYSPCPYFSPLFHENILRVLKLKNIKLHDRMSILLSSINMARITIHAIIFAYGFYGFNEEVVLLIQNFMFSCISILNYTLYKQVLSFIGLLDSHLSLDNLGLVQKQSYRRLLNMLPDSQFSDKKYASIRAKKEFLNRMPTLLELSKFYSQKHIQNFYKIQTPNEFCKIVKNLTVPDIVKNSLCHNPPLYYEL